VNPNQQPQTIDPLSQLPGQYAAQGGAQVPGARVSPPGTVTPSQGTVTAAPPKTNPNSTQNSLLIAEIRDGIVIMQDGSYRAVLIAQSINFDLMSPQEREGVEFAYQGFLNSLYFPVQIVLRSRRIDLRNYMNKLDKRRSEQDNILIGLLMDDYIAYVQYLAESANIMDKQFYVVIPFYPPMREALVNKASKLAGGVKKKSEVITISEDEFVKAKTEMKNRVQAALEAMNQMGVQAVPLNTQELIELYYQYYNPDTAEAQPLIDYRDLEGEMVTKGPAPAGVVGGGA
jgi:type IV secretory pathway VirB4 component